MYKQTYLSVTEYQKLAVFTYWAGVSQGEFNMASFDTKALQVFKDRNEKEIISVD